MNATLASTLLLPTHATASAFSRDGSHLVVGSDDGSVRLYQPPDIKVRKAIRGLGASVSCVLFHKSTEDSLGLWITSGRNVFRFDLQHASEKMILTRSEASFVKEIGQDDEDAVNQLALSANWTCLACTTDNGDVYVMDVSSPSREMSKMKTSHSSIAWTASFIPDRPSELLTGGYDCALLLHDFKLRTLLARLDIAPAPSLAPGISSLPPFITALAISPQGVVTAGTADGRIWVGLGGVKSNSDPSCPPSSSKKHKGKGKSKRARKWLGLNEEEGFFVKLEGEGLVADLHFINPGTLISCTVHGKLALHQLRMGRSPPSSSSTASNPQGQIEHSETSSSDAPGELHPLSSIESSLTRVDILACTKNPSSDDQLTTIAVAGLHADKKRGAVELWQLDGPSIQEGQELASECTNANASAEENPVVLEGKGDGTTNRGAV